DANITYLGATWGNDSGTSVSDTSKPPAFSGTNIDVSDILTDQASDFLTASQWTLDVQLLVSDEPGSTGLDTLNITVPDGSIDVGVPEPASAALLLGATMLGLRRRRRPPPSVRRPDG
ncbi:MAG TPA: PEP-CTERM sorting domain-containing protein, partial [Tepidisphaeraceae bacterium]|nr:PEP-CTERM sorting domain-containing protein [Tepidisphaeraceae bacterium]